MYVLARAIEKPIVARKFTYEKRIHNLDVRLTVGATKYSRTIRRTEHAELIINCPRA